MLQPLHNLRPELLDRLIDQHRHHTAPRLARLWRYYRNPTPAPGNAPGNGISHPHAPGCSPKGTSGGSSGGFLAQTEGLPARLTSSQGRGPFRGEIVIENDIAWRIHTLADFMFAAPPIFRSRAADAQLASRIDDLLRTTFAHAGGAVFFQNLAVLSSVYGHVDILAQYTPTPAPGNGNGTSPTHAPGCFPKETSGGSSGGFSGGTSGGGGIDLSALDAQQSHALTDPTDYRRLRALILRCDLPDLAPQTPGLLQRVRQQVSGQPTPTAHQTHTYVWTDHAIEQYLDTPGTSSIFGQRRQLIAATPNLLGRIPIIHIQNLPQPFAYSGLSDVEPLIPLQNELNTRLSDRANRLTFQAFKMYLGVGIERFTERPVGPGQMWSTDNPDARIVEFGGDSHNPSEEAHINDIREAMDKTSAVSPLAAGIIRGRVGNLTSENALRIVLMGLLAKTRKKRMTFGIGLEQLAELILHIADTHGILPNRPQDRRVRIDWPDPLPVPEEQTLENAQLKQEIGIEEDQVLAELGYDHNQ